MSKTLASIAVLTAFVSAWSQSLAEIPVSWAPAELHQEIRAGSSITVQVEFYPSFVPADAFIWITPSLRPYVTVLPNNLKLLQTGQPVTLAVTITVPATALPSVENGTIHLRTIRPDARSKAVGNTMARPLPVSLSISWEKVQIGQSNISIAIPGGLSVQHGLDHIVVGDAIAMELGGPPHFAAVTHDCPPHAGDDPIESRLYDLANKSGLEVADIISARLVNGGLEILARSLTGYHWFACDLESRQGLEVLAGSPLFVASPTFRAVLTSLKFN